MLNSLQTQKGLELVFRSQFLENLLIIFFLLQYDINWPNFINRLCWHPKLFSKTYFLVCAEPFDDFMKFENLKFWNLIFSRTQRAFEVKWKTFFLVSQVLSFRLKKQTSKNVADTTFTFQLVLLSFWSSC